MLQVVTDHCNKLNNGTDKNLTEVHILKELAWFKTMDALIR